MGDDVQRILEAFAPDVELHLEVELALPYARVFEGVGARRGLPGRCLEFIGGDALDAGCRHGAGEIADDDGHGLAGDLGDLADHADVLDPHLLAGLEGAGTETVRRGYGGRGVFPPFAAGFPLPFPLLAALQLAELAVDVFVARFLLARLAFLEGGDETLELLAGLLGLFLAGLCLFDGPYGILDLAIGALDDVFCLALRLVQDVFLLLLDVEELLLIFVGDAL